MKFCRANNFWSKIRKLIIIIIKNKIIWISFNQWDITIQHKYRKFLTSFSLSIAKTFSYFSFKAFVLARIHHSASTFSSAKKARVFKLIHHWSGIFKLLNSYLFVLSYTILRSHLGSVWIYEGLWNAGKVDECRFRLFIYLFWFVGLGLFCCWIVQC